MKQTIKKTSAVIMALCMILSLFTISAFATEKEPVEFKAYIWADELLSTVMSEENYFEVSPETTTFESNEVYVVKGTVTVENRIECGQNVKLVLTDDSVLNADKGIHVTGSLDIYGGTKNNGALNSTIPRENETFSNIGINTGENGCNITVHGGDLNLIHSSDASCIDAGKGTFTQYAGDISASATYGNGIKAGEITVYSGKLFAYSSHAAGITAPTIHIYDGDLECTGSSGAGVEGKNITIDGGNIRAESGYGAGIGSGEAKSSMVNISSCSSITINDGYVVGSSYSGAAIGSGQGSSCDTITINDGSMSLVSTYGAAIGSGVGGTCEKVIINGGIIVSTGPMAYDPQGFAFHGTDGFGFKAGTMPDIQLGEDVKLYYRATSAEKQNESDYVTSKSNNIKEILKDKKIIAVYPYDISTNTGAILSKGSTTIIIACVTLLIGAAGGLLLGKKMFGNRS